MTALDTLKELTSIVVDSGDLSSIIQLHPEDATTNPSLILKAAAIQEYEPLIKDAVQFAKSKTDNQQSQTVIACEKLAVNIGCEILKNIPGRISTEIDARLSFNTKACVERAKRIIELYQLQGIDKSRVLVKIAATWEGIKAAEILEKEGINCNLTLIFAFAQARACAEANVFLISPFVGRIYDWYQKANPVSEYDSEQDEGVKSVRTIFNYFKQHGYPTVVMGASFRKVEQVLALAGCDKLTVSPQLLQTLDKGHYNIVRHLHIPTQTHARPSPITEADFRWQFNEDAMAVEKLAEGIRLFAEDQRKLEAMITLHLEKA
ncbi:transaldolase [Chania multitudinisentens RB-25]|uniref:Transaldolase n=1 Tax=Chania multitudinisentens RB-25 TaxID=1441930 RepID=W0LA18_9GAMM|nr:transaldolase [Chania multitudinisentens]AHG20561.1 transaldolase [Chania multitudinisentens RB-25]